MDAQRWRSATTFPQEGTWAFRRKGGSIELVISDGKVRYASNLGTPWKVVTSELGAVYCLTASGLHALPPPPTPKEPA